VRDVLRDTPDHVLNYGDSRGTPALRTALAGYLVRARGVVADPERIVITSGAAQALSLLAGVLVARGTPRIAVEDPSLPVHVEVLARRGADVVPVAVDEEGLRADALERTGAAAVVVTAAHQMPLGVALSVDRRAALLAWGGLVVEDDYDAEFRYDRQPLAALQGLAPEQVAYLGSASKTLAPGLRLGWLVLPAGLVGEVAHEKALADMGSDVIGQLTLARLIESGAYDRHVRVLRRRHRSRRDADGRRGRAPSARRAGPGHRGRPARERAARGARGRAGVRSGVRGAVGAHLRVAPAHDLPGLRERDGAGHRPGRPAARRSGEISSRLRGPPTRRTPAPSPARRRGGRHGVPPGSSSRRASRAARPRRSRR
jgi:GntR family transcriptional regulator/MocR family aminotransferase